MRYAEDVIDEFDVTETRGHKKAKIIRWFQKHPGERFDTAEVSAALGDELEIGQAQIQNYLNDLTDDDVLQQHGEKRIGYQLADDIIVPARYQARAVLRHLAAVFDIRRWGIAGVLTITTAIWAVLTFPFWFLSLILIVLPTNRVGPITHSELMTMSFSMTLWLLVFVTATSILYWIGRR